VFGRRFLSNCVDETVTLFQVAHSDEGQYVLSLSSSLNPNDETKTLHVVFNITVKTIPTTPSALDVAAIAGIAIGAVVFVVAVIVLVGVCMKRRGIKGCLKQYLSSLFSRVGKPCLQLDVVFEKSVHDAVPFIETAFCFATS